MGGGDLNMKKSWHPVLLVNQERVWKAEKAANEDKKALAQLRKEREEERQLQELQALQEAATGKKRVDKLDWMYAAPGNEGGALGGQKLGDKDMEDYLLGKKRVDEVLAQGDRNIGNTHKDFIAVQNANTVRDTAAKIREDPLLAIKKQELAAMEAMRNRPEIRKKMLEMQQGRGKESKEERRAKKREEKEERRRERQEVRDRRSRRDRDRDDRSPRSDYSSDAEYRRRSHRAQYRDRDDRDRREREYSREDRKPSRRDLSRSRSYSPRRSDRDHERHSRRDDSPRRRRDEDRRRDDARGNRDRDERDDPRVPPPRRYPPTGGHGSGSNYARQEEDVKPFRNGRPSGMDMSDRPAYSNGNGNSNGQFGQYNRAGPSNGYPHGNGNGNGYHNGSSHRNGPSAPSVDPAKLAEERAAKLAAMTASASELDATRTKSLAQRAEEERLEMEKEERMRKKYTNEDVKGTFFAQKSEMGLSETLGRRNGVGLQRDI